MGGKGSKSKGDDGSSTAGASSSSSSSSSAAASALQVNSVILNVYEPANGASPLGGVYHSGLVLYDSEYSFAQGPSSLTGIHSHRPKQVQDPNWAFKESVPLGNTSLTREEVRQLISEMKNSGEWAGNKYNLTGKNCNHFTGELCSKLGLTMPAWVNRGARFANALGMGGQAAAAGQTDLEGRPLRPEDRAALVLTHAKDVCVDGLLDRGKLACLGAKPSHSLANIVPVDAKGARTQLPPSAILSSDSDEQLLLFLPFTRSVRLVSILLRFSSKNLDANPATVKLFADRPNIDFSDVDSIAPTQTFQLPRQPEGREFSKQELKEGVYEVVLTLAAAKFHSVTHLTVFVENNHGAPASSIHGLTIVGRE